VPGLLALRGGKVGQVGGEFRGHIGHRGSPRRLKLPVLERENGVGGGCDRGRGRKGNRFDDRLGRLQVDLGVGDALLRLRQIDHHLGFVPVGSRFRPGLRRAGRLIVEAGFFHHTAVEFSRTGACVGVAAQAEGHGQGNVIGH
jgi:hypothetical protein